MSTVKVQAKEKNKRWSVRWVLLEVTVVVSVLSQISRISGITRPAMYALWGGIILLECYHRKGRIPVKLFTQHFIAAYALFGFFCIISGLFNQQHFSANYLRVLMVPLLVTVVGDMYSGEDRELFYRLSKLYLAAAVIYALWVQVTYIPSYSSWLSTKMYLFSQKNSAGQIWVAAIFLSVIFVEYRSRFQKLLCFAGCIYLLFMTGICQCRTALLSVGVAIGAYAVIRSKHKMRWLMGIGGAGVAAFCIPFTRSFIEQAFFLNKYAGADLNTFASGRLEYWRNALELFSESPAVGIGHYYVDSSYILILTESGIIGFLLIEWIWIRKLLICYTGRTYERKGERTLFFFMATFYIVESLLEGYPPFGPGVSSFMFWFMSSALSNKVGRRIVRTPAVVFAEYSSEETDGQTQKGWQFEKELWLSNCVQNLDGYYAFDNISHRDKGIRCR